MDKITVGGLQGQPAEGEGLGRRLIRSNASSRPWIYSWAILVFARANTMSMAEVLDYFDEVHASICEKPEEWLVEHNVSTITVDFFIAHHTVRQCLKSQWHSAWNDIKKSYFKYPNLKEPEQIKTFEEAKPLDFVAAQMFLTQGHNPDVNFNDESWIKCLTAAKTMKDTMRT